jgi:hypothetical protein
MVGIDFMKNGGSPVERVNTGEYIKAMKSTVKGSSNVD